ncbi:F-box only protein 5 [Plectropomus leopardus]|uniref:F-box only protein 5 n=1 Tax=Plectropomus leopardus TaxID=160734 RepID=UPI001C4BEAE6|nr:F-box only protein 5 [Plectropomus leopardus]XP_042358252.1 F-box only protein 5 [Plectropomus leopardus]
MFHCETVTMKCPRYEATKANNMEKSSAAAAESRLLHLKASPLKEPIPIKPQCPPAGATTVLFPLNNNTTAAHDKENSTSGEHDRTLKEGFEDSGYLSLHNSQIDDHHVDDEDDHIQGKNIANPQPSAPATHQEKTISPKKSPSKCQGRINSCNPVCVVAASTPVDHHKRRTAAYSLSSTPSDHHSDPNLPILKFQRAVCEELAKGYRKNKRYDWSIVSKVAEDHLLDRVIGGQMGRDYVDMFSCLLSRNMRSILTNILALLGDMDLISCKKVSRTWRKIICEDTAALSRCQRAEQALRESRSSLRQRSCGLTRDVAVSRVVLSCMQTLASSSTPSSPSSSSTPSCRVNRRTTPSQKGSTPNSQCTRFSEYLQAASSLKQHESLRPCKRCGSPATHSPEVQRATCTRSSCLFDFCTQCQAAYHGSTPCRVVQPRPHFTTPKTTPIIPGSARSKRNIRRL